MIGWLRIGALIALVALPGATYAQAPAAPRTAATAAQEAQAREAQARRAAPTVRDTGAERVRAQFTRATLPLNKSQTLRLDYAFSDVLVGNSEIAEVVPLSDRTLYLLGKRTGTTNVSVLD